MADPPPSRMGGFWLQRILPLGRDPGLWSTVYDRSYLGEWMVILKPLVQLALAVAVLSCGGADQTQTPSPFSNLHGPYLGQEPPGLTPRVFAPGLISLEGRDEAGLVVAPGGREIFFWTVEPTDGGGPPTVRVFVTRERGGAWTEPEAAPFSGQFMDAYLAMHPDGSRIYFQSDRPIDPAVSEFEYNLWYVDREGDGWSAASPVGRPVNGRNNTGGPSVTRDGTLYFTLMDFESGVQELFRAEAVDGVFSEPTRLPDGVNVSLQNFDSYVDPDGRYLVFATFERQGHENNPGDLRIAHRDEAGGWHEAVSLGPPINTDDQIGSLQLSADGRFVFFERSRGAGLGSKQMDMDIYWVDAAALREAGPSGGPE